MNRHLALLGTLGLLFSSLLSCTGPSRCALEPNQERCRPTLEQVKYEDTHPRCSGIELRTKRITGLMPLWVLRGNDPWLPKALLAEPSGAFLYNTPESFTDFATTRKLQTFEDVWFHVSVSSALLPVLPRTTFRIFDDANDGINEGPARHRYSNAVEIELDKPRSTIKFGPVQLKSPQNDNLVTLAENPLIEHIGATSGRILYLRTGNDEFVKHKNFDRALVFGSALLSQKFGDAPGNAVLHKDVLADFAADRVVYLDPSPAISPQGMTLTNCPAALTHPASCIVAQNALDPATRAFALSKDATRAAIIDKDGQLSVATLSTAAGAVVFWKLVVAAAPYPLARIWLRFVDVDGDKDEDLVVVYETFPQPFFVNVFRLTAGVYQPDALLSRLTSEILRVEGPPISTLTVGSMAPGSMHVAVVAGNALTLFESQCGEPFLPTQTIFLDVPVSHDWVTGALAFADVSGDGGPDLILGYTTQYRKNEKYLQHLRVFVGP